MKTSVISFANKKGGSGKTTITLNIGAILGDRGYRVLLIDLDPQAHLSYWSGVNTYDEYFSIYDCLLDRCPINKAVYTPEHNLFDIIPASNKFDKDDLKVLLNFTKPENRLNRKLMLYKKKYDFVLIDTPPTFALMTLGALIASDFVIIPILLNFLAIEGLSQLVQNIYKINYLYNPKLKILGIIPNQFNLRSNHAKKVLAEIKENFDNKIIFPKLRNDIKLAEAPEFRLPINLYSKKSKANMDFNLMVDYMLDVLNNEV
ncbi:chromosome partitioning protein, ParA family [Deferribacter desulfuricans SSM1]|uniref:Chromosome partitioning protein, ParA family n=1 Tax=Deferribacter desulfuricans (strain DSM 14783 / JCM 11476 / NBRC 101012 / SSM1) TaxID=639282 RepID=D3PDI9_DEFDS|nr:ParA family protein [Deferribacter desulfuricans]BAI80662.1 chromosome partitioning protein, ParA family [Deferribacter desulfuricans SSM1]